jgi:predicted small lipoprotein YifL
MKKIVSSAAVVVLLLAAAACGKKGGILPPFVYVPQKAENLKAVQRGRHILLDWTNPESYTDGRPLAGISAIEVWIYEAGSAPPPGAPVLTAGEFESKARRLAVIEQVKPPLPDPKIEPQKKEGPAEPKNVAPKAGEQIYQYLLTEKDLKAGRLLFAVRVKEAKKGRFSDFSDHAAVSPQPLPLPPGNIRTQVFEDRIQIGWDAPQENFDHSAPARLKGYNIYRIDSSHKLQRLNPGLVREEKFNDANFLFGQTYRYFVRAAASEATPVQESEDSATTEVTPKDVFPPAAPAGLTAIKGANFITLIWDAGRAKDLAGYKVWRREAGQDRFVPLTAQSILENTYTDTSVEKDKRYEYAITALDHSGNESPKSETVSEIIKDGWP